MIGLLDLVPQVGNLPRQLVQLPLEPLAQRICVAFIYGSGARGELTAGSDVDVLVIGGVAFGDVVEALHETQARLGREVNPSVFTPVEWADRLRRGDHLASALMRGEKLFVIGDEHDLGGVAGESVADQPSHES